MANVISVMTFDIVPTFKEVLAVYLWRPLLWKHMEDPLSYYTFDGGLKLKDTDYFHSDHQKQFNQ